MLLDRFTTYAEITKIIPVNVRIFEDDDDKMWMLDDGREVLATAKFSKDTSTVDIITDAKEFLLAVSHQTGPHFIDAVTKVSKLSHQWKHVESKYKSFKDWKTGPKDRVKIKFNPYSDVYSK